MTDKSSPAKAIPAMKDTNERLAWIDNLRLIATVAVVVVHVATPPVFTKYDAHNTTNIAWWTGNIYDSFCRFCVPVFVMLTGALVLPQKISLSDFLRKRLYRIFLPFAFWSIIYIFFNIALKAVKDPRAFNHMGSWLFTQVTEGAVPHLWYVYMIIGIYLFIPIIQPWMTSASNKAILYFLGIWFITMVFHQLNLLSFHTPFDAGYFSGYIGYLVLGYYISEKMVITPNIRYIGILLFIVGFLATLAGTFIVTHKYGYFSHIFYEYLTCNVLFAASGLFVFIKSRQRAQSNAVFVKIRSIVSRYGYGIYLSHLLVLSIITHFKIDYSLITPLIGIPVTTVICLFISTLITMLINKLPYGKYVSG